MRSHEYTPCPALRPYVRLYWVLELDEPAEFGPAERISPDGLLELVFHYRTPVACRYDGEEFRPQPLGAAVSQTRRFVEIRPAGPSGLLSVRFEPWGACHFLGLPMTEIADRQTPIAELWGAEVEQLQERLAEASGDRARIALVEGFLLAQLAHHRKVDVEPLVRTVWRHRGRASVGRLCDELGIGERRLQRTFAAALGTTPKRFARLTRFLNACDVLSARPPAALADVGLACGYYDQSHFTAEFRSFSGMTPREFARARSVSFLELA